MRLIVFFIAAFSVLASAQTMFLYEYDSSGNVVVRRKCVKSQVETDELRINVNAEQQLNVVVAPNPTNGLIKVSVNIAKLESLVDIMVQNSSGNLLFETSSSSCQFTVDISDFPVGVYFLTATVNGKTKTIEFIKN